MITSWEKIFGDHQKEDITYWYVLFEFLSVVYSQYHGLPTESIQVHIKARRNIRDINKLHSHMMELLNEIDLLEGKIFKHQTIKSYSTQIVEYIHIHYSEDISLDDSG